MKSAAALSRRSLLGLAALGLAACKKGSSPPAPRVDPDAAALADAIASEYALINASEAAGVTSELGEHQAHLAALGARPFTPLVATSSAPTKSLPSLLRSSAPMLRSAAVAAISGAHAAAFASIAASHEAMLRD